MSEQPPTGEIYDLGYKRYAGARRSAGTRWRVVMRHQLSSAWKTWWRFKSSLGLAVIVTFIAGGFLYLASNQIVRSIGSGGMAVSFAEGVIPLALTWYHRAAFLASLMIGATVVASDMQSGAFTFYFARSVRPVDYVLGRLAGLSILFALLTLAGPMLLAGLRLGLSESTDQLLATLPVLGKVIALGLLSTLVYAAVPLGFSALVPNRRYALAIWAAYYLIAGSMALALGFVSNSSIAALDLPTALERVTFHLFDVTFLRGKHAEISLAAAVISLATHVVLAIAVVAWRVRHAQRSGVGGAS